MVDGGKISGNPLRVEVKPGTLTHSPVRIMLTLPLSGEMFLANTVCEGYGLTMAVANEPAMFR
mgnify:CR=1 FL=1